MFDVLQHIPSVTCPGLISLIEQLPRIWSSVAPGYFAAHTMQVQTALCVQEVLQSSPSSQGIYANSELTGFLLVFKNKDTLKKPSV